MVYPTPGIKENIVYDGAVILQTSGVSARPKVMGQENPVYDAAHASAVKQSGTIYASYVDNLNRITPANLAANHLSIYVQIPGSNTRKEINSVPR